MTLTAEVLNQLLNDENTDEILKAVREEFDARGMTDIWIGRSVQYLKALLLALFCLKEEQGIFLDSAILLDYMDYQKTLNLAFNVEKDGADLRNYISMLAVGAGTSSNEELENELRKQHDLYIMSLYRLLTDIQQ